MDNKNKAIGVFDSGLGGVSVLKELIKSMPNEKFIYFGDSANAPYGIKTNNKALCINIASIKKALNHAELYCSKTSF